MDRYKLVISDSRTHHFLQPSDNIVGTTLATCCNSSNRDNTNNDRNNCVDGQDPWSSWSQTYRQWHSPFVCFFVPYNVISIPNTSSTTTTPPSRRQHRLPDDDIAVDFTSKAQDQQGPETGLALVSCLGETGGSMDAAAPWRISGANNCIHIVG